jgi:hypothetical protein
MFPPTWVGREFVPGNLEGYMFRLVRRLYGHLSAGEIYYKRGFARGLGRTSKMSVGHKYSRGHYVRGLVGQTIDVNMVNRRIVTSS